MVSARQLKIPLGNAGYGGGVEPSLAGAKGSRSSRTKRALDKPRSDEAALAVLARAGEGQLLYDRRGRPIAFQDANGNLRGADDASLPPVVEEILGAGARRLPATAYELWQQRNPKGTAEDYLKLTAAGKIKPLDEQLRNAVRSGDTDAANAIRRMIRRGRS